MNRCSRNRLKTVGRHLLLIACAPGRSNQDRATSAALAASFVAQRPLLLLVAVLAWIGYGFPALALTPEEQNTIAIYEKVAQSVVNITTTSVQLNFFFQPVPTSGAGSGVIIADDGTIVTSYHVVAGARRLEVTLTDGSKWPAKVIGTAPANDLAAMRIDLGDHTVVPIKWGDSDQLQVGQKVFAIGNPFGLGQTLTVGVVSQLGRNIEGKSGLLRNLIQVDASINPGNSGGALVDSDGHLIGINTAIVTPTGSNIGIGFAIPVNQLRWVLPDLVDVWTRRLAWLLALALVYWLLRRVYRL